MSVHVSLNLLKGSRKRDEMQGSAKQFIGCFLNEFNKFNNTGAQMLVFCLFVCLI